jgi:hypothetical protein
MGNLFRLNSLFEKEVSFYPKKYSPNPKENLRKNAFEYLFLPFSSKNDTIMISTTVDLEFKNYIKRYFPNTGEYSNQIPKQDLNLIEWGKFSNLKNFRLVPDDSAINESKKLNSKKNQSRFLKNYFGTSLYKYLDFPCEIEKIFSEFSVPLLFKAEYGFSGIGHFFIHSETDLMNFKKKISNPIGIIEPHFNKTNDFSILLERKNGSTKFLSSTRMEIDSRNQFRGIALTNKIFLQKSESEEIVDAYCNSIGSNYEGPLTIDGFFIDKTTMKISEFNFRFSIGRLLLQISKFFENYNKHSLIFQSLGGLLDYESINDSRNFTKMRNFHNQIVLMTPKNLENNIIKNGLIYHGK